jgi:two-component system OmpR family response regulator
MRVLVIESDRSSASLIRGALRRDRMLADVAHSGEQALWMAAATAYDVLTLELRLPGISGLETCRRLRAGGVRTPMLMLSRHAAVEDRIVGLETGADDFLAKPFDVGELCARLRALARRGPVTAGPVLEVGDLTLHVATHTARRGDVEIALSAKELQVLEVFMRRPGQVLSRFDLLEGAWDMHYENRSNVVDVYVRYLRDKIDRPFGVDSIETVRGAGYRLRSGRSAARRVHGPAPERRQLRAVA